MAKGGAPIQITLYDPETGEDKKTYSRAFIPWGFLKAAIKIMKKIDPERPEAITEELVDEIAALIVDFFRNEFTLDELNECAEITEMVTVIMAIQARAGTLMQQNPTRPGK